MAIVGALLENEAIAGLSEGKPTGFRRTSNPTEMVWTPDDLIAVVSWMFMSPAFDSVTEENGMTFCVALTLPAPNTLCNAEAAALIVMCLF